MATRKRGPSTPATTRSAATNSNDVKVLVSSHRGLGYPSSRTGETIEFDKEIGPGIFTPSAPVSNDLAEEYRSDRGTVGVLVYGSLKREMTLAEIDALQPDDPETVEKEMRSIATQYPGRGFYDVIRVPRDPKEPPLELEEELEETPIEPHALTRDERIELKRALGRPPSNKFIREVEEWLGIYLWDREQVRKATRKQVRDRVAKVRAAIEALRAAIYELQASDLHLIGLAVKRESLKNRPTISTIRILGFLTLYLRHVAEAEMRIARTIAKGGARGRMFAYAEEAFARHIAELVWNETGKRPTTTRARKKEGQTGRGSIFTRVLTILLDFVGDSIKPRTDVEALARRALKSLPSKP